MTAHVTKSGTTNRWPWVISACLVLWAIVWLLAFYPGLATPDTREQLAQGKVWEFDSVHPVIFSAMLGLADRWTGGLGSVFIAQIVLITGALVAIGWRMSRFKPVAQIAFLVLACAPVLWAQWAAIWKDVWFSLLLLWSIVFLLWHRYGLAAVTLVLMCCFRHNAITVALPLAVYVGLAKSDGVDKFRGALWALGIMIGVILGPKALDWALSVQDGYPAAPSLVFDVVGAYRFDEQALSEGPFADVVTYAVVTKRYNPDSARFFTSNRNGVAGLQHKDFSDDVSYGILKKEWSRVIKDHPRAYLSHRLSFARSLFGLRSRPPIDTHGHFLWIRRRVRQASWLPSFPSSIPLSRPWMWALVAVIVGWAAWRQRRRLDFALVVAAAAYFAGNLVIAPSSPLRYHTPTIISVIVALPAVLDTWIRSIGHRSSRRSSG